MPYAALERVVDFLGSRNAARLTIIFQNVFARSANGAERVFKDKETTKYIEMNVAYYPSNNSAEIDLRGYHYRSDSTIPPIKDRETWELKNFTAGRFIEFYRGDRVLSFVASR